MKWLWRIFLVVFVCFILPAIASLAVYTFGDHPDSWRAADWSSSGLLPAPRQNTDAAIYVLAARAGGLKGALSVHSWIVFKERSANHYTRYDKVGWGLPVRKNSNPADGRWYSNEPAVIGSVHGAEAEKLIPDLKKAIAAYPFNYRGGYRIWPGPNSNTFVATVLRSVPALMIRLPSVAVGKDYLPLTTPLVISPDWRNADFSLLGLAGLGLGLDTGVELRFAGLVFGVDILHPALKLPGFGRIGLPRQIRAAVNTAFIRVTGKTDPPSPE